MIAEGMDTVDGELGMMPVDDRIVQADLETLRTESIEELAHEVALAGRVGGLIIGELAVKQAITVMML